MNSIRDRTLVRRISDVVSIQEDNAQYSRSSQQIMYLNWTGIIELSGGEDEDILK